MQDYAQRQEAKKERYAALAVKTAAKADALYQSAHRELSMIPFGQPILVGHHSERPMRNMISRNHNKIGKSFELQKTAEHYEHKAENLGSGGISSDDPEAINKLQEKLVRLQAVHQAMKDANKAAKGSEKPYMSYQLSNSNANIHSIERRIKELTARAEMTVRPDVKGDGWTLSEDKEENRIMFTFPGVPAEDKRTVLKRYGFKWSPTRGAWVRQLNQPGRYAANTVAAAI